MADVGAAVLLLLATAVPVATTGFDDGRMEELLLVVLPFMPEFETTIPLIMVVGCSVEDIPVTSCIPPGMLGIRGCCGTKDVDDKLVVTISLDEVTTVAAAVEGTTTASEDGTADKDVSIIDAEGLIVAKAEDVLDRSADALVLS